MEGFGKSGQKYIESTYGKGNSITSSLLKFKCNFTNDRELLQEYNEKIFQTKLQHICTTTDLMNLLTEVCIFWYNVMTPKVYVDTVICL